MDLFSSLIDKNKIPIYMPAMSVRVIRMKPDLPVQKKTVISVAGATQPVYSEILSICLR